MSIITIDDRSTEPQRKLVEAIKSLLGEAGFLNPKKRTEKEAGQDLHDRIYSFAKGQFHAHDNRIEKQNVDRLVAKYPALKDVADNFQEVHASFRSKNKLLPIEQSDMAELMASEAAFFTKVATFSTREMNKLRKYFKDYIVDWQRGNLAFWARPEFSISDFSELRESHHRTFLDQSVPKLQEIFLNAAVLALEDYGIESKASREKLEPLWEGALYSKEGLRELEKQTKRAEKDRAERAAALEEKARREAVKKVNNPSNSVSYIPPLPTISPPETVIPKKFGRDPQVTPQSQEDGKTKKLGSITAEIAALEVLHPKDAAHKELNKILLGAEVLEAANKIGEVNGVRPVGDKAKTDIITLLKNNPELAEIARKAPLLVAIAVNIDKNDIPETSKPDRTREKIQRLLTPKAPLKISEIKTAKDLFLFETAPGFFAGNESTMMRDVVNAISYAVSDITKRSEEGWAKKERTEYLAYLGDFIIDKATGKAKEQKSI